MIDLDEMRRLAEARGRASIRDLRRALHLAVEEIQVLRIRAKVQDQAIASAAKVIVHISSDAELDGDHKRS